MKKVAHLFYDKCNGRVVYLYQDYYGKKWMAQSRFGCRVLKEDSTYQESTTGGIREVKMW